LCRTGTFHYELSVFKEMDVKNKNALNQRNEKTVNAVSINRIPVKASKITRGHSVDRIPEYFGPPGLPGPVLFYS
jgi:hypothetical protein